MPQFLHSLTHPRAIAAAGCVVLAILCVAVCAPRFSDAATYAQWTDRLDQKRQTAIEVSAVLAGASVAIAAVPGDATTPIADQIAGMNSYLIVVIGAIMLEKYLLPLIGMLVFYVLLPAAFLLLAAFCMAYRRGLLRAGIAILILGVILQAVIPVGIVIGDRIDRAYGLEGLTEKIEQDLTGLQQDEAASDTKEEETGEAESSQRSRGILERVSGFFSDTVENISENATVQIDKIKVILGDLLDAIAALILSTCVIPVVVLLAFYGMARYVLSLLLGRLAGEAA